jgi:hypothetical protein
LTRFQWIHEAHLRQHELDGAFARLPQREDSMAAGPCPCSTNTQLEEFLRNATEHAARHADNSLISHVLASHAPSIFREMRHWTFVCTENAPLDFSFLDQ